MTRSKLAGVGAALTLLLAACGGAAAPASSPAASSPAPVSAAASKPAAAPASSAASAAAKPAASGAASATAKPAGSGAASATAKPVASGALTRVRYGLPTSSPDLTTVGIYFGIDNNFFKDAGLDVQVMPYNGSTTSVRALLTRDADVVMTSTNVFDARTNGAPVKIISSPIDKPTDEWVATKNIASFKDLAGKSFAISTPNSPGHVATKILAQRNGIGPDSIQYVSIGAPADRIRALLSGKVDATDVTALGQKPLLDAIDAGQVKVLDTGAKQFPELPLAYDIATEDTINTQAPMLNSFIKAEIQGYRWAQQNPDKAAAIVTKHVPEADAAVMTRSMKDLADLNVLGIDGGISVDGVDKTVKTLVDQNAISKPVKGSDIAETKFVDAAVKSLGS
jgi:ABC-type nitrate/sulfonate/bicarbonate transport system substrate-binding protein